MTDRLGNARPAALALALLLLCCCGLAGAADRIDRGFGQNGKVVMHAPSGGVISDLALTPNNEMVAAVSSFSREGSLFGAARLRADGRPDRSFGQGGKVILDLGESAQAQGITTQPNGRILIAGSRTPEGTDTPLLARLLPGGSLDPSFGAGGLVRPGVKNHAREDVLYDVAVQPSGRLVAVGARNERKFLTSAATVVAYRPDGSVARAFGTNGEVVLWGARRGIAYTGLRDVVALPSGKLLASGFRRGQLMLVRLGRDGRLDRSFGDGDGIAMAPIDGNGSCLAPCIIGSSVAVERSGRIVVLASSRSEGPSFAVARFTPEGRLDRSFAGDGIFLGPTALSEAMDLALQPGGGIVVVGFAGRKSDVPRSEYSFAAVRLTAAGRLDRSFGKGAEVLPLGLNSVALAALTQPGRGVVVAGGVQAYSPAVGYSLLLTRFTR